MPTDLLIDPTKRVEQLGSVTPQESALGDQPGGSAWGVSLRGLAPGVGGPGGLDVFWKLPKTLNPLQRGSLFEFRPNQGPSF